MDASTPPYDDQMPSRRFLPRGGLVESLGRPLDRWPVATDVVLAVLAFVASVFVWARNGEDSAFRSVGDVPLPAFAVFAVAAAVLVLRRQRPVLVFAVVYACSALAIGLDYGQVGVASLVAVYSVGRYCAGARANAGVLAAAIVFTLVDATDAHATVADAAGGVLVTVLLWYAGRGVRHRGDRAALLVRERAAQESRVLADERARIARELHDVVAHGVSLMTVQAGAAKTVAAVDPQAAVQAMAAVEQAGREALGELRHLLAVLRPDRADEELGPQPGLADVPRLVDQLREAGLRVSLDEDPAPAGLPGRVDLFAFRIVQEAMTNVLKHAGPGTAVEVTIRVRSRAVTVDVVDDGHGVQPLSVRSGHGLVGMRERTQLLGGTLVAAPRAGGGFQVTATLPLIESLPVGEELA
jgi:signal transduction histidine kinase